MPATWRSRVSEGGRLTITLLEHRDISSNTNPDGSDNPEGRKYNRRVSINIINDGYYVPLESYTYIPRHLRNPNPYTWFVVLYESDRRVEPGYFDGFSRGELAFRKGDRNRWKIQVCDG
ncbi:MAG: hypothetical protein R2744_04805 [Bacteroidales bacterium]